MNVVLDFVFVAVIVCLATINFNILSIESYLDINMTTFNFHVYRERGCVYPFLGAVSRNISAVLQIPIDNIVVSCSNYSRNFSTNESNNFYSLNISNPSVQRLNIKKAHTIDGTSLTDSRYAFDSNLDTESVLSHIISNNSDKPLYIALEIEDYKNNDIRFIQTYNVADVDWFMFSFYSAQIYLADSSVDAYVKNLNDSSFDSTTMFACGLLIEASTTPRDIFVTSCDHNASGREPDNHDPNDIVNDTWKPKYVILKHVRSFGPSVQYENMLKQHIVNNSRYDSTTFTIQGDFLNKYSPYYGWMTIREIEVFATINSNADLLPTQVSQNNISNINSIYKDITIFGFDVQINTYKYKTQNINFSKILTLQNI